MIKCIGPRCSSYYYIVLWFVCADFPWTSVNEVPCTGRPYRQVDKSSDWRSDGSERREFESQFIEILFRQNYGRILLTSPIGGGCSLRLPPL